MVLSLAALSIQTDHRVSGHTLPVVRIVSIEPSSTVREGMSLTITIRMSPPGIIYLVDLSLLIQPQLSCLTMD